MTFEDCKKEVAKKHGLGSTLVTGHLAKYWQEAAELYSQSRLERMEKALEDIMPILECEMTSNKMLLSLRYFTEYTNAKKALSERSKG
jgi:hypothetical protein